MFYFGSVENTNTHQVYKYPSQDPGSPIDPGCFQTASRAATSPTSSSFPCVSPCQFRKRSAADSAWSRSRMDAFRDLYYSGAPAVCATKKYFIPSVVALFVDG